MIVVDASVVANAVGDDAAAGRQARALLREHVDLAAPDLVDVETTAVLRRHWLGKTLTAQRFEQALEDLAQLPIRRFPALPLMRRAYELRANVTAYDAAYVALAELLDVPLFTGDRRLSNAAGTACAMHLVALDRTL